MLQQRIARVEAALGGDPDKPTDRYAAVREKIAMRDRAALDLAHTEIKAPRAGMVVNFRLQLGRTGEGADARCSRSSPSGGPGSRRISRRPT